MLESFKEHPESIDDILNVGRTSRPVTSRREHLRPSPFPAILHADDLQDRHRGNTESRPAFDPSHLPADQPPARVPRPAGQDPGGVPRGAGAGADPRAPLLLPERAHHQRAEGEHQARCTSRRRASTSSSEHDYEQGMRDFRRESAERLEHWLELLKERGLQSSGSPSTPPGEPRHLGAQQRRAHPAGADPHLRQDRARTGLPLLRGGPRPAHRLHRRRGARHPDPPAVPEAHRAGRGGIRHRGADGGTTAGRSPSR